MKISELKALLAEVPDHLQVVMAKDEEGNGFSPLSEFDFGVYEEESTWGGEFSSYIHDEEGNEVYPTQAHTVETGNAICFWPTN